MFLFSISILAACRRLRICFRCVEDDFTQDEYRCLQKELDIMKRLQPHPNITALLGCCTKTSKHYPVTSTAFSLTPRQM